MEKTSLISELFKRNKLIRRLLSDLQSAFSRFTERALLSQRSGSVSKTPWLPVDGVCLADGLDTSNKVL